MFSTVWNTQRFTELGREEKVEGGDRDNLVEKKESPKGERAIKPVITKSLQSCPTLCDPIDSSPPGSPIRGILQAGTLEWVAISFSNA